MVSLHPVASLFLFNERLGLGGLREDSMSNVDAYLWGVEVLWEDAGGIILCNVG